MDVRSQVSFIQQRPHSVGKLPSNTRFWSDSLIRVSVTRQDPNKDLVNCQAAINDIIKQCISGGPYEGGVWSFGGETYKIYNDETPGGTGPITAAPASASVMTEVIAGATYTVTVSFISLS